MKLKDIIRYEPVQCIAFSCTYEQLIQHYQNMSKYKMLTNYFLRELCCDKEFHFICHGYGKCRLSTQEESAPILKVRSKVLRSCINNLRSNVLLNSKKRNISWSRKYI